MSKAFIKLAYKQVIHSGSVTPFEQAVFNDTYAELLMQVQVYNPQKLFNNWAELTTAVPKAAQNVPYKTAFSIGLYVKELTNVIPGLTDNLDQANIPFANYKFEIIDSHFENRQKHKVSITYLTATFTLLTSFGEYLVLSTNTASTAGTSTDTIVIKMQPGLSVVSYEPAI
ncbi:hypothetical protein C3K47_16030 [Solitalea longa]|uniref:Uncharacterized protein n=1 Tax=Solitalea longa TaxID=2079460 RepID=A0A2S4ZY58_9SPHI|nr:hypothetical protein [Solitalea longa]POY35291.1 hypothetical protein C3K47_16030 [Solitalea longa]